MSKRDDKIALYKESSAKLGLGLSEELIEKIQSVENVKGIVPRLSYFSYAYSDVQSKGIIMTGIDPELENEMTNIV